jgi:hypothetical protein
MPSNHDDVVAIVDPGEGSTPVAKVAGPWVYDAYGELLNADHILPFPHMRLGHRGFPSRDGASREIFAQSV